MSKEEIMILLGKLMFTLNGTELLTEVTDALNELLKYKQLDNANPSKALEELKRIDWNITYLLSDCDINEEVSMSLDSIRENKSCEVIKQALLKAQEQEKKVKALEIIKEKNVDVLLIKKYDFVEDYNSAVWISGRPKLVKEEFDLLKEVLE